MQQQGDAHTHRNHYSNPTVLQQSLDLLSSHQASLAEGAQASMRTRFLQVHLSSPSFFTSFLFLLSFLRSSTLMFSTPSLLASSQCWMSPSTQTCIRGPHGAPSFSRAHWSTYVIRPMHASPGTRHAIYLHAGPGSVRQLDHSAETLVLLWVIVLESDLKLHCLCELPLLGLGALNNT